MRKPTVHYLSLRNIPEFEKQKRRNPPSGQKQDYIIDCLVSAGYKVNYVSFSESFNNKLYLAKKKKLSDDVTFFLTPNVPGKYRESFAFRWFYHMYSLKNIKKGDILLVYHTNSMRNDILRKLADKKHLKFIYEVEEIYEYIHNNVDERLVDKEIEFLQCPDKYIFCTEMLAERVNKRNLPFAVVEGYFKYSKTQTEKFGDGKIHCVYGGIIDDVLGGAYKAVEAAKYLPENYVIHILGYGNVGRLKEIINQSESERKCDIFFEGLKNGKDYIDFISKCDVGLCLRALREDINSVSFPSKLIMYMTCGLPVVAGRIKAFEQSKVASAISFYDEDTPESIANAIIRASQNTVDTKTLMDELDCNFKKELKNLLDN